ncbi:uncharacterized protein TEOVI_000172700 [Trypanosoma equiperdum]|uniref:Uncharacterized protein n=1 Tax=Trypanosoma equiperdum TaxID=5694 RepID=A0A1G4ICT3_TRYEQ|nr:hypothetical protein TEOVI_000172700 [Trypanosoma equiperdum]
MPPQAVVISALSKLHTVTVSLDKLSFKPDDVKPANLINSPALEAALKTLIKLQSDNPKEKNPDTSEITKLKNRIYGADSDKAGQALWEAITKTPSSNAIAEGTDDTTSDNQNIAQLAETAGYYISKTTKPTSKQAQCTSHKAKTACATLSREKCTDICE